MGRTALLIAVLVYVPLAQARGWVKISSPHFELYTSSGEKRGREVVAYFEQVRDVFTRIRGPQSGTRKVRLVAFSTDKEYQPFRVASESPAYYVHSDDLDCIVLSSLSRDYSATAVHEYTHLWMRSTGAALPAWLHEGLAEVHSTLSQRGGKVWIGDAIPARLRVLRTERWIPFELLTRMDRQSPQFRESDRVGVFYAESWLLAHMLYLDEPFRPRWPAFIQSLLATGSTEQAAADAYGKTLSELQQSTIAYARRGSLPALWFDARLERPSETPITSDVSDPELALIFAQLYRLIGKPEAGEKLLANTGGTDEAQPALEEERAALAWKSGDLNSARTHYRKAIELRSTNAQMYIAYAELVHEQQPEEAERALTRALELQPDSKEAHFLLGYVLATHEKWQEALKHLSEVREVSPGRAYLLFDLLARAQYRTGLVKEARQSAARSLQYASNPSEVAGAKSLIAEVGPVDESSVVDRRNVGKPTPEPPKEERRSVQGTLRRLDCNAGGARIQVATESGDLVLLIDDPSRVTLTTPDGNGSVSLACGPQKPRRVRVEFTPVAAPGVAGRLQRLDLLP